MKDFVKIIMAVVVTSLLWLVAMQDANYNNLRKSEKEIWIPTLIVISDLRSTSKEGKQKLLDEKIELLEKKWRDYSQGGDNPISFYEEIIAIGKKEERKKY